MTTDELQAALDAATATLSSGGIPRASLHARDVLALAAEVTALRDVLSQTERERDEARAKIARYVAAVDEHVAAAYARRPRSHGEWCEQSTRLDTASAARADALAALRETPAGEGGGR